MSIPLLILAIGSIFIGYLSKDVFIGLGTPFFDNSIFILPQHYKSLNAEFLDPVLKLTPVILSFIAAGLAILLYSQYPTLTYHSVFYTFLNNK